MADNTTQGADETIATDDIGGIKYQRMKLTLGGDGENGGDVAAGNPMPVELSANYAQIVYEDGTVLYVCKAAIGSALASAVWQIKKVETADPMTTTWADGDSDYDNVATNLVTVAALTYS